MFYDVLRTCSHPEDPNAHRFQWPGESEENSHRGHDLLFLSALIFQLMFKRVPASAMFSARLSALRLITEFICNNFLQLFFARRANDTNRSGCGKTSHSKPMMWPRSMLVWAKKNFVCHDSLKLLDGLFIWPSAQFKHTITQSCSLTAANSSLWHRLNQKLD